MTALLSGVVVVLVVCHTPKTVINLYECYQVNKAILKQNPIYWFVQKFSQQISSAIWQNWAKRNKTYLTVSRHLEQSSNFGFCFNTSVLTRSEGRILTISVGFAKIAKNSNYYWFLGSVCWVCTEWIIFRKREGEGHWMPFSAQGRLFNWLCQ